MTSRLPIQYPLLSETEAHAARGLLEHIHEHFYHFTLDDHIESIKNTGLAPSFEGEDSRYGNSVSTDRLWKCGTYPFP